jgi:hypothetical protein
LISSAARTAGHDRVDVRAIIDLFFRPFRARNILGA